MNEQIKEEMENYRHEKRRSSGVGTRVSTRRAKIGQRTPKLASHECLSQIGTVDYRAPSMSVTTGKSRSSNSKSRYINRQRKQRSIDPARHQAKRVKIEGVRAIIVIRKR